MTTPSPFEIGRAVSGNISNAIRGSREDSALEEILANIQNNQAPENIGTILQRFSPERQQVAMNALNQQRQQQAYREQGLNPNLPESFNKEIVKGNQKHGSTSALQTLQRMREIQSTGHLGGKINFIGTGRKFGSTFSSEGQKLRSEYERLGKSLIQSSTNIPIRNKAEFETLAHDLYDTKKSNEEILGTLDAMERIIRQSTGQFEQQSSMNNSNQQPQKNQNAQFIQMKDPSGVIRNIPIDQVQQAQQAGGVLIQ